MNKTLIPLTITDKFNNIEFEFKLKQKLGLAFFLSIVKLKCRTER